MLSLGDIVRSTWIRLSNKKCEENGLDLLMKIRGGTGGSWKVTCYKIANVTKYKKYRNDYCYINLKPMTYR